MLLTTLRFIVLTLTIMLIAPITKAANVCEGTYTSQSAALTACQSIQSSTPGSNGCQFNTVFIPECHPTITAYVQFSAGVDAHRFAYGNNSSACTPPEVENPTTGLCEPPATCSDPQGSTTYFYISSNPQPLVCHNGCKYSYSNIFGGLTITNKFALTTSGHQYISTGSACDGNEPTNTQGNNSDVTDQDLDGLPEINGEELPQSPPPSNGCLLLGDGSMYCGGGAPTPPSPDNGTPGMGATPDQTITNTNTNTTNNHYGSGTVSGSSTGTPDGQDPGVCDPSIEICGTDEESASDGGCGQLPTCTGDPIQCTHLKVLHETRCNLQTEKEDVTETEVMEQLGQTETLEEALTPDPEDEVDVEAEILGNLPDPSSYAGNCPADLVTALPGWGIDFTIPSQPICDVAVFVRPFVIGMSYLISMLMVFNGVIRTF